MPERSKSTYVDPDGTLMWENLTFGGHREVTGVEAYELWSDAYERNFNREEDLLLFPAKECSPFPFVVDKHRRKREEFVRKGGGFRLDLAKKIE
jgi:hypothetical protein